MDYGTPVTELKGIGKKTGALFHRIGIDTVGELLSYYPRSYDVYEPPVTFANLEPDGSKKQAVTGFVRKTPSIRTAGRFKICTLALEEFGDRLSLVWFNTPYVRNQLSPGSSYVFRGYVKKERGRLVMEQPQIFEPTAYEDMPSAMQPVYPLTAGLSNKTVTKAVRQALDGVGEIAEYLPSDILKRQKLTGYDAAVRSIHFPENAAALEAAAKRLKFNEFFTYAAAVKKMSLETCAVENDFPIIEGASAAALMDSLGYELTSAQKRSWDEIRRDLNGTHPMMRLLQGDVGSGKTVVAVLALVSTAECGFQSALMAPTEVLARQHFQDISRMLERAGLDFGTVLLTGSLRADEKRRAYEAVERGEARIIIGTHALIQEKLHFQKLGLVVTDEQHRFGVRQRQSLYEKGSRPHFLSMSATPIPRSLASAVYGGMDISVIDEMPADRLPIKNCVVGEDYRPAAWRFIAKEVGSGHQAYVVCPMVEDNPELSITNVIDYSGELKEAYGGSISVEYLHGRMSPEEKEDIMERFASCRISVLVSTTVIEVGINVRNATVMLVEDAERFGLTQLHQLRGRVGRGSAQGYCIFISSSENASTMERLKLLEKSNDGFFIASEDLRLRGPGDLPGVRQSGLPSFKLGDIFSDTALFTAASEEAAAVLEEYPEFFWCKN